MKIITIILRVLLGAPFLIFGLNKFFGFIEMPPMEGEAGQFMGLLFQSGYLHVVGLVEVVCGALILVGLFTPLALVVLMPVCINILLFHLLLAGGSGIELGLILTILNVVLMVLYLPRYLPLLKPFSLPHSKKD